MTRVSEEDLQQLINSDIAANKIATETGVSASAIQRIRLGERKLGNLTFDTCKKLQKYWEELNVITLTAIEQGVVQTQETFKDFAALKQHLLTTDYFSWIKDNEPDRELPDFTEAETVEEVQAILDEYDYSWWTVTTDKVNVWIKWTGRTTDGNKKYTAEAQTYKDLYAEINGKYGYGNIIDEEYDDADRSEWTEDDYKEAIEESRSEAYYHEFNITVD